MVAEKKDNGAPQVMPVVEMGSTPRLSFTASSKGKPPAHLADFDMKERKEKMKEAGFPAFRADQLSRHYFERHETAPETLTDIPAAEREEIASIFFPPLLTKVRDLIADEGKTIKSVWRLFDGALIETVLMRYPERTTLCVSSQSGCGMACPFCATGQGGLTRNLSVAEIIEQVRLAMVAAERGELAGGPARVSNIVFMGMGE
ncbi:MAG: 23S rRNA (adenine(2503)-C(2))-methyltransferase RlmN, partial [Actinomycetaceae bacterium]|nr:23S rRNA (adenine(2503)-C(2))-methyltransferase RlmN [Actinomycetaceae bacterium]